MMNELDEGVATTALITMVMYFLYKTLAKYCRHTAI